MTLEGVTTYPTPNLCRSRIGGAAGLLAGTESPPQLVRVQYEQIRTAIVASWIRTCLM
jgi:hypothetical protein